MLRAAENRFPINYKIHKIPNSIVVDRCVQEEENKESFVYECPLYGVADRHFTSHESALLEFIHLKSDMEPETLVKRGAALLAVKA